VAGRRQRTGGSRIRRQRPSGQRGSHDSATISSRNLSRARRREQDGQFRKISRKSIGKSSLTISAKPVGVGAASQRLSPAGEQSGLQTRTAATETVSLCERMKR